MPFGRQTTCLEHAKRLGLPYFLGIHTRLFAAGIARCRSGLKSMPYPRVALFVEFQPTLKQRIHLLLTAGCLHHSIRSMPRAQKKVTQLVHPFPQFRVHRKPSTSINSTVLRSTCGFNTNRSSGETQKLNPCSTVASVLILPLESSRR